MATPPLPSRRSKPRRPAVSEVGYDPEPAVSSKNNGGQGITNASTSRGVFDLRGAELQPLPFVREEVTSAAQIGGKKSVVLLGQQATEANLKSQRLEDFQVLHFAVHGIDNAKEPDRSGLVLRPDPTSTEDGLWQAREIRHRSLKTELVTLSACETGVGKLEGEEGVANLVRAFLVGGQRVL